MLISNIYLMKYQIIWMTQIIHSWKIHYHGPQTLQNEFENLSNSGREHRPLKYQCTRYGMLTNKYFNAILSRAALAQPS